MNSKTNLLITLSTFLCLTEAWSPIQQPNQISRRNLLQQTAATSLVAWSGQPQRALASPTEDALIKEIKDSQNKLIEAQGLLKEQEWDKVRTILKTPPVNKLWNLGDSQNPVSKLAKETGNVEWFEIKDDLAYNLQMCDQLTYDNVFVYFQPGSGKLDLKGPNQAAEKAISQIQQILDGV
ncbi:hypothetical protein ACHAXS_007300 [Conticribra weissflogii]